MPRRSDPQKYAQARASKREGDRRRIHEHVLHPIDTPSLLRDPLYHPASPVVSTIGTLKLVVAAIAVHGFIIMLFATVNGLMGEETGYQAPERVQVRVIQTQPPPPPPVKEEEEEEGPVQPDFAPKKVVEPAPVEPPKTKVRKKPKLLKQRVPEPVAKAPDQPAAPVRRHIGISFESTTTGGSGPSLAVGTSRMGTAATTAADPKVAKQAPELSTEPGPVRVGTGAATREQRKATNIPTRDAVFVKPKRAKPSKPPYPTTLKAQGIEGDVQVRVRISVKGKVVAVTILKSSGHKSFDDAAAKAAWGESFMAATRDGSPVVYTLSYSYRFRIEEN